MAVGVPAGVERIGLEERSLPNLNPFVELEDLVVLQEATETTGVHQFSDFCAGRWVQSET